VHAVRPVEGPVVEAARRQVEQPHRARDGRCARCRVRQHGEEIAAERVGATRPPWRLRACPAHDAAEAIVPMLTLAAGQPLAATRHEDAPHATGSST
jgi:hypothetical protein